MLSDGRRVQRCPGHRRRASLIANCRWDAGQGVRAAFYDAPRMGWTVAAAVELHSTASVLVKTRGFEPGDLRFLAVN